MENNPTQRLVMLLFITIVIPFIIFPQQKESIVQNSSSKESTHSVYDYTKGQWLVEPLVLRRAEAPETGGKFIEFGKGYWLDSGVLLFWSRFGRKKKNVALYSLKEGQIRKVLVHNVAFSEPDSIKKKVERTSRIHCSNRMVYFRIRKSYAWNVYGWDGERFFRILAKGDEISLLGTQFIVESAAVLRICKDGKALIKVETSAPKKIVWMALHDGTTLTPLWGNENALPGMGDAVIKQIFQAFCFPNATLAAIIVNHEKLAIFRITPEKTERIIGLGDENPTDPSKIIGDFVYDLLGYGRTLGTGFLWASGPETFVVSASTEKKKGGRSKQLLLFYNKGKWQRIISEEDLSNLRLSKGMNQFEVSNVIFPCSGKPSFLFTVRLEGGDKKMMFPDLYLFEDDQLSLILWPQWAAKEEGREFSTGDIKTSILQWHRDMVIRNIPGNLEGVIAEYPYKYKNKSTIQELSFPKRLNKLFDPNSKGKQLLKDFPEFENSSGKKITLLDVIAWKSATEAVVKLDDGFFLITRQ